MLNRLYLFFSPIALDTPTTTKTKVNDEYNQSTSCSTKSKDQTKSVVTKIEDISKNEISKLTKIDSVESYPKKALKQQVPDVVAVDEPSEQNQDDAKDREQQIGKQPPIETSPEQSIDNIATLIARQAIDKATMTVEDSLDDLSKMMASRAIFQAKSSIECSIVNNQDNVVEPNIPIDTMEINQETAVTSDVDNDVNVTIPTDVEEVNQETAVTNKIGKEIDIIS